MAVALKAKIRSYLEQSQNRRRIQRTLRQKRKRMDPNPAHTRTHNHPASTAQACHPTHPISPRAPPRLCPFLWAPLPHTPPLRVRPYPHLPLHQAMTRPRSIQPLHQSMTRTTMMKTMTLSFSPSCFSFYFPFSCCGCYDAGEGGVTRPAQRDPSSSQARQAVDTSTRTATPSLSILPVLGFFFYRRVKTKLSFSFSPHLPPPLSPILGLSF